MPAAARLGSAQNALFFGAKQFCQSKFELKLAAKTPALTHVGVFAVDFSRIDTGKTVCFLVSGGLSAVLSRVVYVNYSSVSIRP